jgi:diaminopimelate epimerase
MKIKFSKMQALGNDFMVIDAARQTVNVSPATIIQWADRRLGIGFDQLLMVAPATVASADFNYRIFNADGTEVEQCGNGARCVARFIHDTGLSSKTQLVLQTKKGFTHTELMSDSWVKVNLGQPNFVPKLIPATFPTQADRYTLKLAQQEISFGALSVGNPHAIIQVDDVSKAAVKTLGPLLETHTNFPQGVNVSFMEINDNTHIKLRVWERGVGETPACGSGACAAVVMGRHWQLLGADVEVSLSGGNLSVSWQGDGHDVYLSGEAQHVYAGDVSTD